MTYNPWNPLYKQPFGAVKNGSAVNLRIDCQPNQKIKLLIHRDFGNHYDLDMPKNEHGQAEISLNFKNGAGLYFYYFKISETTSWGETTYYYGSTLAGGLGQIYNEEAEVLPYQITVFEQSAPAPAWFQQGIAYQIFPDRFFNGSPDGKVLSPKKNSFIYGQTSDEPYYIKDKFGEVVRWDFFGGNLLGIIAKIPYLKSLGVTVIYLNPIFEANSNHRYDTGDFFKIDSVLGTQTDFNTMVEQLHQNGIRLILDGVFSHVGKNSKYFNYSGEYGEGIGAAQSKESPYFQWFSFEVYPDDYKSWWNIKDLPEVDKTKKSYQAFIEKVLHHWLMLGVDGFRLDVADELPDEFIKKIRKTLDQYPERVLIGEVWEDASNKIAYQRRRDYILGNSLQSVMNYPLREGIIDLLTGKITANEFAHQLMTLKENYPREVFYANLNNIGTHDTERIRTMIGDQELPFAIALLFILPGVPTVYYGDEFGLTGNKDPENRKFMPWELYPKRFELLPYQYYQKWLEIRQNNAVIQTGELTFFYQDNCLGIVRKDEEQSVIYLLNLAQEPIVIQKQSICWLGEADEQLIALVNKVELAGNSEQLLVKTR